MISRRPDADVDFVARSLEPVRCDRGLTVIHTDTPATLADPDVIVGARHVSTLRLALRVLLGDRPLQMAARVNGHAAAARGVDAAG